MLRMITVCYNVTDSFGTCVVSNTAIPPSDFKRSNYANLIWAKWRILSDTLLVARLALWLDADVLILRNPWPYLDIPDTTSAPFDIRYQSENPCIETECAGLRARCGALNGGQLLLGNRAVAQQIYEARPQNLTNTDELDQDYADRIIHNQSNHFTHCPLTGKFFSHCWVSAANKRLKQRGGVPAVDAAGHIPVCDQVTHHFNCITSRKDKSTLMMRMISNWQNCGHNSSTASHSSFRDRSAVRQGGTPRYGSSQREHGGRVVEQHGRPICDEKGELEKQNMQLKAQLATQAATIEAQARIIESVADAVRLVNRCELWHAMTSSPRYIVGITNHSFLPQTHTQTPSGTLSLLGHA